jgi:hypothetical protein
MVDRIFLGGFKNYTGGCAVVLETRIGGSMKKSLKNKKVKKVMEEFKEGELHSGSKKRPQVTSRKQAMAIALSESGQSKKRKK